MTQGGTLQSNHPGFASIVILEIEVTGVTLIADINNTIQEGQGIPVLPMSKPMSNRTGNLIKFWDNKGGWKFATLVTRGRKYAHVLHRGKPKRLLLTDIKEVPNRA